MTRLADRLAHAPRYRLGTFPTPLEPMPRLTRRLGGPQLWVKRDDAVGPALGGNKTRKLEFLIAQALARRAEVVATFGGLQSNFARQMAAAARAAGLEPHCFYFARRPARFEGNLLLLQLLDARLHFVPLGGGGATGLTLEQATRLVGWIVRLTPGCAGRRTYYMPVGGHVAIGAAGYALAAEELNDQLREAGIEQATVVVGAGTGGTLAGLLAGLAALDSGHRLVGIDVGKLWKGFPRAIAELASEVSRLLHDPQQFHARDVPLIESVYAGPGYGLASPAGTAAMRQATELEGLVLDPVYTAKAFAGMLDLCAQGRDGFRRGQHVVFLHTGGLPAVWAYEDSLSAQRGQVVD